MLDAGQPARQEIRQPEARRRPVEDPVAVGARRGRVVARPVLQVAADAELMSALDDGEVVGRLVGVVDEQRLRVGARVQPESAGDRQRYVSGQVAVNVRADVARREELVLVVVDLRLVHREARRVDHRRIEDGRFSHGERVHEVVRAWEIGLEEVIRVPGVAGRLDDLCRHVAAEERELRAHLVVEPDERLAIVAVARDAEVDEAARIGRRRQPLRDVQCRGAERRRAHRVVDERRAERHLTSAVAGGRGELREVAGQHRRRRHELDVRRRPLAQHRPLIGAEEKQFVLHDRPAQRAAELAPLQAIVLRLAVRIFGRKRADGVEAMVAQELERVPGEAIRAGLRNRVHRGAGVDAVLRGEAARGDPKLLQRIGERQREVRVLLRVVVHGAVERVADAGRQPARDRDVHAAGEPAAADRTGLYRRA